MKIGTRLRLAVYFPALMALVIAITLLFSYLDMARTQQTGDTVRQIRSGITELNHIVFSYALYHEERPKQQFLAGHAALNAMIDSAQVDSPDQQRLLNNIRENNETIGEMFQKLVANYEQGGTGTAGDTGTGNRLVGMLLLSSYEADSTASTLRRLVDDGIRVTQIRIVTLILLVLVLASVTLGFVLSRMRRHIVSSLSDLGNGARVIGSGDLDYRINESADDEIGDLSRAFNLMTGRLKEVTVSRLALEREMVEREKAEEELRLTLGRLQTFFDHRIGGIGILIGSAGGDIIQANDYYLNILGCTREELLKGQVDWRKITPPEWLPADELALTQLQERGVCDTYEKEYQLRDGTRVPVLITDAMMPGDSGDILAFVLDITERKQAEKAATTAHRRLQSIINNTPAIVYALDLEERFVLANTALAELLNSTPEQMLGKRRHEFMPKEDADWHEANDRQVIEACRALEFEEYSQLKGRSITWLTTKFPLHDAQGGIYAVAGISADISERKQAEEQIKSALAEKEVLLKEIHHRVKNNMQVISSLVSLQAGQSKDNTVRDVLQDVSHRVRSMSMVHEKLYRSPDLARINFADYAQSLIHYLWRSYGSETSGIRLINNFEPVLLTVNQAVPCGLILNELVSNSLKHAFPGNMGGEVTVSLHNGDQGKVVLGVRDNGAGLPEGFDWSSANSLGLRIVQMLAGQIGASVECSSSMGTEFKLTFEGNKR